ncbi:hypothetical protein [uncultured Tolumonas sp.]|uniref:hypothetical protein n=1 Tax=uncultured Tolumonas sp. TaxID=263765 RepID=UPI0029312351|nr:hypothetical protein [uncultured Tolumonas sp.]
MKNGILYAAIAAALGAGAYYAIQQQNAGNTAGTLNYVPADTLVFMGDLEPASWKETISPLQARFSQLFTGGTSTSVQEIERLQKEIDAKPDEWNDGLRVLFGLYAEYVTMLTKGTINPQDLGFSDKLDAAFYTVGALPVLRFKLENEANFDKLIAAAETRTKAKADTAKLKEFSYKRYFFNKDKHPVAFAIGKKDGFAILTLDLGDMVPADDLAIAFGITKPAKSLKQAATLEQLVQSYGFRKNSLGFINNELLIKTLTRADSPLAKLLDKISEGESNKSLAEYRTPECQKDIESIASLWPREIFGYTNLDTKGDPIRFDSTFKIESKDAATMASLQKLRGFIPDYGKEDKSLFKAAIGLNVDELAPVTTELWNRATQAQFTCTSLKDIQNSLKMTNPSMLAMGSAMVQGLQGASLDLQELKLKNNATKMPAVEKLSFVASVSSKQPQQLWGMLSMASPELAAQVKLPADGQSVDLPVPPIMQLPGKIKLGLYGQHITVFTGDQGAKFAASLAKQPLTANGFYQLGLDYGLLADMAQFGRNQLEQANKANATDALATASGAEVTSAAPATSAAAATETNEQKEMKQVVTMLDEMRGVRLLTSMDFEKDGLAVKGSMELPQKK